MADLAGKVDAYVQSWVDMGRFSGAVFVAKKGNIILSKGYGFAHRELDVPITEHTKFHLASLSKQFTATAITLLHAQGKLEFTDPLTKFIPDYPNGDKVTVHHLLSHTSGIFDYFKLHDFYEFCRHPSSIERTIERFKNKPLDFEPGEKASYSNGGYVLLSYIVQKASGMKYEDFLQKYIFEPLGMHDSGFLHVTPLIKNRAAGYDIIETGFANTVYTDKTNAYGTVGIYSTILDLYKWDRWLYTEKLLSKQLFEKMCTPVKEDFGYGLLQDKIHDHRCIWHNGEFADCHNIIMRLIDDDICIIVLSNVNFYKSPTEKIGEAIAAIMFDKPYKQPKEHKVPIVVDPKVYADYVGQYEFYHHWIINVFVKDNRLYYQPTSHPKSDYYQAGPIPPSELFPYAPDKFFFTYFDPRIFFVKDASGTITHLVEHRGGEVFYDEIVLKKLGA